MKKRFPNDNNIDSTVSMAFYLVRHGNEVGLDFEPILSSMSVPENYVEALSEQFTRRNSKHPRNRAVIYERALKLLFEFMKDVPYDIQKPHEDKKKTKVQKRTVYKTDVPRPDSNIVKNYLNKWPSLGEPIERENALQHLFKNVFPRNDNINEILVKCSVLNDFYSTNIFNVNPIAKHIHNLKIDKRLDDGDSQLPNDISKGHGLLSRYGKELHLFSFATKYCSHHNQEDFPIYDSYVDKLLVYFKRVDSFSEFGNSELRDYIVFKKVIGDFKSFYQLEDFTLKEIDQFLWQFGKDYF